MFYRADARHERFWRVGIAPNAVFFHSFVASKARKVSSEKARWCGGSAAQDGDKICATPARESDLEVKIVKNWQARSAFGCCASLKSHHACVRERFGSRNRKKLTASEHFWKLTSPKFAPRLRARSVSKSKSLKHRCSGRLWRFKACWISTCCK